MLQNLIPTSRSSFSKSKPKAYFTVCIPGSTNAEAQLVNSYTILIGARECFTAAIKLFISKHNSIIIK